VKKSGHSPTQSWWQDLKKELFEMTEHMNLRPHRGGFTVEYRKNARARHYILRVDRPGRITVTLPPKGNMQEAKKFLASREDWIRRQMAKQKLIEGERRWMIGKPILWRGEEKILRVQRHADGWHALLGEEKISLPWGRRQDIIGCLVSSIRRLAHEELSQRTSQLALETGITPLGVSVRDQRSRWGSCSSKKHLSLNWRLLQAPPWVRDYVIIHELVHIKHFNHGAQYWKCVEEIFPRFKEAELWLKCHGSLLREPSV
jgi:predicted metal-dependent hydrolase